MKVDKVTLKHFLKEIHLIQRGKTFNKRIVNIEESEKQRINLDRNLLDLFLFRIDRDPGAYGEVLKIIKNNERIQKKTIQYIKKLLYDLTCDVDSFIIKSSNTDSNEKISRTLDTLKQNFSFSSHNTLSSPNVEASIEFLKLLHESARKNYDETEATVIKRIIDDFSSYRVLGKTPFVDDPTRSEMQDMLKWDNQARAHIFSRIKKPELYIEDQPGGYDLWLHIFLPYNDELRDLFAETFHIERPSPEKLIKNQELSLRKSIDPDTVCYYKFTNEAVFIAAEFWFNELEESEKIAFLNNEYPIILDERSFERYSVQQLAGYADDLDNNGYLDMALEIYKTCLSRSSRMIDQFYFSDNVGCCYRDLGNYPHAFEYFYQANNLIKKVKKSDPIQRKSEFGLRNTTRSHSFLVCLSEKNVGEMLYQIGKPLESEKYYRNLIQKICRLKDNERYTFLLDLAQSYQNIDRFEDELKTLVRLSQERTLPESYLSKAFERISVLQKSIGLNHKINSKYLSLKRDIERGTELIKRSVSARNSFQNQYAIKILSRAPIIPEPYYHAFFYHSLGISYFRFGDYSNAKKFFSTSIDESLQHMDFFTRSQIYLGLCEILTGNKEGSIVFFQKALSNIFTTNDKEQSEQQFGFLLSNIAIEATWFDQEIVSWFVEQHTYEVDKHVDEPNLTFIICSVFISICQFSKAINYLDNLLVKTEVQSELYPLLLYRKGTILIDSGDYLGALDQFTKAIQIPHIESNYVAKGQIFHGMAIANVHLSNYIEAERYAIEAYFSEPSNVEYCRLKEKLEDFNLYHVSTESIKCLEARYTFNTAEREALELYSKLNDTDEFDFSPPLGYYGKGLEILLDVEVWQEIRKKILEEYSTDRVFGIPKRQFKNIPKFFRWALSNDEKSRETVSLGTWENINFNVQDPNPIVNSINQNLAEKFGQKYTIIKEACKFLAPFRNDVFHKLVLKKTDMEKTRKDAVQHVNNVISLLYGTTDSTPSLITKEVPTDILKFEEASKFFRNNEYGPALKCYEDAINHDPTNTDALVGKANVYVQTGEADKAIRCLEIALHLDPNDFDAHRVRGYWYVTFEKDWHKAAECFQKALEINPKDDMAMLNLGCAFWEIHEHAMGLKCFKKVKEINPDNPFVNEEYSNCVRALVGLKEELLKIHKKIEESPNDIQLIFGKASIHYSLGEYYDAYISFEKVVKLAPEDILSWYYRGFSLLRLGRESEANQSFDMVNYLAEKNEAN